MQNLNLLFDTPGIGGVLTCVLVLTLCICYGLTIRWISKAD